jgi:hypothetical protein
MLMVIFGAGASYDSAQAYPLIYPGGGAFPSIAPPPSPIVRQPWRPPLANELFLDLHNNFGQIIRNYPKLTHVLPLLRERVGGKSVEEVLETLLVESKGNPETKKELASVRFYLCELLNEVTKQWLFQTNGVTNYAPLLRDILRFNTSNEPVCLVTFNYDLLLEHSLYTFDFKAKTPNEQFDSHPILKLFKLHGSVEWARVVVAPSGTRLTPQGLIETADTVMFRADEFVRANPTDPYQMHNHGRPIFPAIAIPVQTKTDESFECPRSHITKLCEMLKLVTKVLIIGWQAKEAHFTQILRSNLQPLRHICVVGSDGKDADKILNYFMQEIAQSTSATTNGYASTGGFTNFILNGDDVKFLEAR